MLETDVGWTSQDGIKWLQMEDEVGKKFKELEPDRKSSVLLKKKAVENSSVSNGHCLVYNFLKTSWLFIQRHSASVAQPFHIFGMTVVFENTDRCN